MSEDVYCEAFEEKDLAEIAQYFQVMFEAPQPLATDMEIFTEQLNNARQKIIQMDCLRTRSTIFSDQIKKELERMLTHYVRLTDMQYKQGLNQIAAPFILLRKANVPISKCQIYFHLFFKGYCLNFYDDNDFNSIELFVKMFSIVLKYHDPGLHRYLNWFNVEPQIFCIGWLMTLFANKVSLKMVYSLWQFLVAQKDKFLLFFLVLGIVMTNKDNIIQTKNAHILTTVTNLIFKNDEELQTTIQKSLLLRKNTPNSLVKFFRDRMVFEKRKSFQDIHKLVQHLQKLEYFLVLPSQMSLEQHLKAGLCTSDCYLCDSWQPIPIPKMKVGKEVLKMIETSNDLRGMKYYKEFVLVDVRKDKGQKLGYRGDIFRIDISNDIKIVEQEFLGRYIEEKSKKHFVFMLTSFNFEALELSDPDQLSFCKKFLQTLISFSFPLLGMLEGGFRAFFQYSSNGESKIPEDVHEQPKIDIFASQPIQLPQLCQLKLSERFKLGTQINSGRFNAYPGLLQTLILFDNIFIIVQNNKDITSFINYFNYNNSVMAYLYQHPNFPEHFEISFMLSLKKLKKASMKIHNQNILVLCYHACEHTEASYINNLSNIMQFGIYEVLSLQNHCKDCKVSKKKIIIEMESNKKVQDCVSGLTHNYGVMNKKIKLITNEFI